MNYRYKLQESLDDSDENYTLKSNEEIKDIIQNFGCGWEEFHTADIERLIKEHEKMYKLLVIANKCLHSGFTSNEALDLQEMEIAIKYYKP